MVKKILIAFLLLTGTIFCSAQKIASFEVELTSPTNGIEIPTSVSLDNISFVPDSLLTLVEVSGAKRTPIPFQITQSKNRVIHWIILPRNDGNKKRVYELVKGKPSNFDQMSAVMKDGSLTIQSGNKNLLRYWYKTVYPPAGIDSAFKRSGFIHPLWTPNGQELTRIQAPDHYHHYGIWNPWTHVLFEGDTVDFWNLRGRKVQCDLGNLLRVTSGLYFPNSKPFMNMLHLKKIKQKKCTE